MGGTMDTKDFMDSNGIDMFDTWDGYAYTDEGYELEPEDAEEGLDEDDVIILNETQYRFAELNRAIMKCGIENCGNTVINLGGICYYCKKKERGLI
jgi:hypothetical protein